MIYLVVSGVYSVESCEATVWKAEKPHGARFVIRAFALRANRLQMILSHSE